MELFESDLERKYWIGVFKNLDEDGDGLIHTSSELKEYLRTKHVLISDEELYRLTDGQMILDVYRFLRVINRISTSETAIWRNIKRHEGTSFVRIKKGAMNWFGLDPEASTSLFRNSSIFRKKHEIHVKDEEVKDDTIFFPEKTDPFPKEMGKKVTDSGELSSAILKENSLSSREASHIKEAIGSPDPNSLIVKSLFQGNEKLQTQSPLQSISTPQSKTKGETPAKTTKLLLNPKIIAQLRKSTPYRPYFIILITVIDIALMIYGLIYNHGFEPIYVNPMAGVSSNTLVRIGAKYVPCMKPGILDLSKADMKDLESVCGMNGFKNGIPNQWYRFITAIFLHSGMFHLAFNLVFQLTTGCMIERKFGFIRIFIIYFSSGIIGNLFGALMQPKVASVGASGALYGLLGVFYLDLFQNWPLLVHPWRNFFILTTTILVSLAVGLLPYIDNYAHVGGILCGIISGIIFCPTIVFGKWDARRKLVSLIIAAPLFVIMFVMGFLYFYVFPSLQFCSWCRWFNCIPPDSNWCQTFKP